MRLRVLVAAITATAAFVVAPAAPAAAAFPTCYAVVPFVWDVFNLWYFQPADPSNHSRDCMLREGEHGLEAVATLQYALHKCYGQDIARDGDFGPATKAALINAQTWERYVLGEKITVDGVYGPKTGAAMRWPMWQNGRELPDCLDPM